MTVWLETVSTKIVQDKDNNIRLYRKYIDDFGNKHYTYTATYAPYTDLYILLSEIKSVIDDAFSNRPLTLEEAHEARMLLMEKNKTVSKELLEFSKSFSVEDVKKAVDANSHSTVQTPQDTKE